MLEKVFSFPEIQGRSIPCPSKQTVFRRRYLCSCLAYPIRGHNGRHLFLSAALGAHLFLYRKFGMIFCNPLHILFHNIVDVWQSNFTLFSSKKPRQSEDKGDPSRKAGKILFHPNKVFPNSIIRALMIPAFIRISVGVWVPIYLTIAFCGRINFVHHRDSIRLTVKSVCYSYSPNMRVVLEFLLQFWFG